MMHESSVHLPDEIIELILSKCPVEFVLRFKSVSKSWQSIISGPRFSRIHRNQQSRLREDKNKLFLWRVEKGCLYLIRLMEDENFERKSESVLGSPFYGKFLEPLCSCDGLILFRKYNEEHVLWNPLSRKHITIPAFNRMSHPKAFANWPLNLAHARHCHLYHDSIADDYKIVLDYEEECYTVYSCKNGSWGEIKEFPRQDWMECKAGIDGCLYDRRSESGEIICFDARDGKLHKFPQPEGVETLVPVRIVAVSGRLCLYGFSGQRLHLWVMEEKGRFDKSWRKLISMGEEEKEEEPYTIWDMRPVYFTDKDDVVLWARVATIKKYGMLTRHCTDHVTFIYNPRSKSGFKKIDFSGDNGHKYFSYSENLDMPSSII